MLVLFDIDGTLLLSSSAGLRAMRAAGQALFGRFEVDGVDFAGRLDPLIWGELAAANGIDDADARHEVFRARYGAELEALIERENPVRALPGVHELVDALDEHVTLGILTGNYPETGRLKLRGAGVDPDRFTVCAWGSDAGARDDLPPVAIARDAPARGRTLGGEEVVIIGDTPHDVACARAHGCRVIGVATGPSHEAGDLAGADLVVDDLTDTRRLVDWVISSMNDDRVED